MKKHSHCHLQQYNSLLHPNHYQMPWCPHRAMLRLFLDITLFQQPDLVQLFGLLVDIFVTLDTFGG